MKELLNKIQKVSDKLKSIEKDMTVGSGNYSYKAVSDLQVVLKVKEAEQEAGIISIPIKQELVKSEVIRTNKKQKNTTELIENITYVDLIKMTVRIYNLEDDKQFLDVETFGRGLDSSDKGFGKASTYARKYALLNAYKIATGEDPDADKSEKQLVTTRDDIKITVFNYLDNNTEYTQQVLQHFNAGQKDDLTADQIKLVYTRLKESKKL